MTALGVWIVWVTAAVVVTLFGGTLIEWERRRRRRHEPLSYDLAPRPHPRGLGGVMRQAAESIEAMAYGRSYGEWKRRCEASTRASRRRRGLEP